MGIAEDIRKSLSHLLQISGEAGYKNPELARRLYLADNPQNMSPDWNPGGGVVSRVRTRSGWSLRPQNIWDSMMDFLLKIKKWTPKVPSEID